MTVSVVDRQRGRNARVMNMRGGRRGGVVLVALVVGMPAIVVGNAAAAGWLAPVTVPLSVNDLGFDQDGNAIAVGVGADASGDSTFRSMTRSFGGQWNTLGPVSGAGDSDVRSPRVAVDPNGDAVAVWSAHNQDAAKYVVRASSRPAGGAWSDPVMLSDGGVFDRGQEVAIDAQGNATAIWTEILGGTGPVVRSASRPNGGDWSEPVDLSEGTVNSSPRMAVDPQGTVTAVWLGTAPHISGTGVVTVVRSRTRSVNGDWSPTAVALSSDDGTSSAAAPQVAVDAQGNATAVWGQFSSADGYVVQTARRAAGGSWSEAADLGGGDSPQVAVDPQGNATAIWQLSDPSSSVVLSSSRTAAGPWSNPAPMAAGDNVDRVGFPWVGADPQGNVTAIWARYNATNVIAQATRHVATSSSWSPSVDLTVGRPITAIPAAGVDPQGHVSVVWSWTENPWSGASSVFDPIAPTLENLVAPASATAGQPVSMSVNPFDAWSAVTISWNFGDGQSTSGAAVSHTFGSPGVRTVTVTGVDAAGNTTQTSEKITVNPAAVLSPPIVIPKLPPTTRAPVLSGLQQTNARWLLRKAKRGSKLPVGTTFRFRLDRAAQVRFAVSQIVAGRRVNGRCVKATKANRRKPRCDRAQAAGTLNVAGKAGANSVAFRGSIRGRGLQPGRYRVLVTALADGKHSTAKSLRFTIVR
jgi:hypothetical protein